MRSIPLVKYVVAQDILQYMDYVKLDDSVNFGSYGILYDETDASIIIVPSNKWNSEVQYRKSN